MSIYMAHLLASASTALGALNTAETAASSTGDQVWRRWGLDLAAEYSVRAVLLVRRKNQFDYDKMAIVVSLEHRRVEILKQLQKTVYDNIH